MPVGNISPTRSNELLSWWLASASANERQKGVSYMINRKLFCYNSLCRILTNFKIARLNNIKHGSIGLELTTHIAADRLTTN